MCRLGKAEHFYKGFLKWWDGAHAESKADWFHEQGICFPGNFFFLAEFVCELGMLSDLWGH